MLTVDGVARGEYRGVTGSAANRRMIKAIEVQLLPPRNQPLLAINGITGREGRGNLHTTVIKQSLSDYAQQD
jgi:hypothetical protein